ncbi:unnamed protein product [Spirodela intermedia]|uniref:Uncharacterized protein n=1 Tax=Spirodela intermedia TaxID=51605 RepID=A0A7I8I9V1_SPIIN|nr:unnamed protein product [Spirodela intermedia]CAA6654370.1 unnamed protein product [Spirodela intermedia]
MEDEEAHRNDVTVTRRSLPPPASGSRHKRKASRTYPMGVALFMTRCSGKGQPPLEKTSGRSLWKSLLATVRPLHHHHSQPHEHRRPSSPPVPGDDFHDVLTTPNSRYASAEDLPALNDGDEADGPHAIDVRAEEFIAKFYEQMRLQRLGSVGCKIMPESAC